VGHHQRARVIEVLAERAVQFAELILLGLSEGTVRTHLEHIYRRLHVSSRAAAITRAFSDWDA
jgi:ATP/maltotriose-dependent transcriptional regulator MalT